MNSLNKDTFTDFSVGAFPLKNPEFVHVNSNLVITVSISDKKLEVIAIGKNVTVKEPAVLIQSIREKLFEVMEWYKIES